MKKLLFVFICAVVLSGCSKKDDTDNPTPCVESADCAKTQADYDYYQYKIDWFNYRIEWPLSDSVWVVQARDSVKMYEAKKTTLKQTSCCTLIP